jgi:hypothetical protein
MAFAEEPAVVVGAQGNRGRIEETVVEASRFGFSLTTNRAARRHDGNNVCLVEEKEVKRSMVFYLHLWSSKRVISEMPPKK